MEPTITNTNGADKRIPQPERSNERRSELICRVKYGNTLPDIPFDLKFLQYPFDSHRFVKYNPTSLERSYKYEVLTEHDLGVTIDLINRDLYHADPNATLHPADEKLLEEDVHAPQDSLRSRQHSRSVSWLRKSEYISTEQTRFQPQNLENIEAKVGYNVKKSLREQTLYLDREAQVKAIEKTFSDAKKEITKHYSKPNVTPVEVLPIFPDFENWKYPCAQVIFDSDPAPAGKNVPAQIEEMSQAMIRGVMDESGEQFVAYFLPTEDTLEKRRQDMIDNVLYKDGEEYIYKIAREYNWNVKSKASKGYEENYFFVVKNDGVYYNELETRVRLSKRRVRVGQPVLNTSLVIKHRPVDANEHRMQRYREKQLDQVNDDDEEEEMEETKEADKGKDMPMSEQTTGDRELRSRSRSRTRSGSHRSTRSRSDSAGTSRSRSRSRSQTGSPATTASRSVSRSRSRSKSQTKAHSRSNTRSRSRSHSKTQSRSLSRSNSKSPTRSRSRSRSKSHSKSPSRSRSKSHSKTPSRSPSKSPSRSRSKSHSKTPSRSRSKSQSKSPSRSPSHSPSSAASNAASDQSRESSKSRSGSASPAHSGSGSNDESDDHQDEIKQASKSPSPAKEQSKERALSPAASRTQSQSRSPSPSSPPNSHSESESNSASDEEI